MPETPADGPAWSCAEIRLLRPYRHASIAGRFEVSAGPTLPHGRLDITVMQRSGPVGSGLADIVALTRAIRTRGSRLVYDLDDDLLSPHPVPGVERELELERPKIRFLLREADLVTVSSAVVASRVRAFNARVAVWRNALDEALIPPLRLERPGADIGYFGTFSHLPDLMGVMPSLEEAAASQASASLEFCGVSTDPRLELIGRARFRTSVRPVQGQYDQFHRTLAEEAGWKVGLAPLRPTRFNAAKSDIKALDYAAAGIAAVVADHPVYADLRDGEVALRRDHRAFGEAVFRLLRDGDLRRQIAGRARDWLFGERILAIGAPLLADILTAHLDGARAA